MVGYWCSREVRYRVPDMGLLAGGRTPSYILNIPARVSIRVLHADICLYVLSNYCIITV
jgi:hypothetical protein